MAKHNELGKIGEDIAYQHLLENGLLVLERNWRHGRAEVDLIAKEGEILVFVEVKTRSTDYFEAPEASVGPKKQRFMASAASAYMEQINYESEVRFDIVGIVYKNPKQVKIDHFRDAFFPDLSMEG